MLNLSGEPADLYFTIAAYFYRDKYSNSSNNTILYHNAYQINIHNATNNPQLFHGAIDIVIEEQFIFDIDGNWFMTGKFNTKTYTNINEFNFCIENYNHKHIFEEAKYTNRHIFFVDYLQDNELVLAYDEEDNYYFFIKLSIFISITDLHIKWIIPTGQKTKCFLTIKPIEELYYNELLLLKNVIQQYLSLNIGIDTYINIENELKKFLLVPDFINPCTIFLKEQLIQYEKYKNKKIDSIETFSFNVEQKFNKEYYCAAKMADDALSIKKDKTSNSYIITFKADQLEQIRLMYINLLNAFNQEDQQLIIAKQHLINFDFPFYLYNAIFHYILETRKENGRFGYYHFVNNSILYTLMLSIKKGWHNKLTELYRQMIDEKRVKTKWASEYKLYSLIKEYIQDAKYQYRTNWLENQSIDIYIPSQKIGIEYQGEQHYKPVEIWGGEQGFIKNQDRDKKKYHKALANGVKILYWKYDIKINKKNLINFFNENQIIYKKHNISTEPIIITENEMAPIIAKPQEAKNNKQNKKKKTSKFVVRQFDTNGIFIKEYSSAEEAAKQNDFSERSINKVIYGYRQTYKCFIWKKFEKNAEITDILPITQVQNTGLPKSIIQIDSNGKIIALFKSIGEASKLTGIGSRGISDTLAGKQKTSGGYIWRYTD